MKLIHYQPTREPIKLNEPQVPFPIEALSQVIFQHTSLEEALEELRREGYIDLNGEKVLKGIKDLLKIIKSIRKETCNNQPPAESPPSIADGDGPVKSGVSMNNNSTGGSARFLSLSPQEALSLSADHFYKLESLEKDLKRVYWGYDLNSIDEKLLEELLGTESLANWQIIKRLNPLMLGQGLAEQGSSGLKLTSLGMQKIAWNILKEIFKPRKNDPLSRRLSSELSMEPYLTEGTRPYRFGDPPLIDTCQSLLNAIKRTGTRLPVQLRESDFAVFKKEIISRSATVILLDLSKSMRFGNRYIAAKKVALALFELVRKRYPKDRIAVVGFSTKAYKIKNSEVPFLTWDETNPYTNMEEALDISQKILSLHKGYRRQVFLITDGEPTAHREKGYLFFQFPPHPKTLFKTLKRFKILSQHNIDTSIFLLSEEKERVNFVHEMARRCGGRVFHIQAGELGRCLLMDYIKKKIRWI